MFAQGTVLLDKYVVDRPIGHGGMATVFAATHLHLNEQVAIKCIAPELAQNSTIVQRFLREARAAVRLRNEHVTRVLDVGVLPWGQPYMVMELLQGMDLAELLKARGMLAPHEAVDLILQVCEALAEAHVAGIVHRDIKPSNLFITTRPDGSQLIKVLDFGISKVGFDEVSDLTQQQILGTPSFMSPEQLRGLPSVDARSDIWSLGIVLYRMLGGHQPFKADSMSALAIQCATEPTPLLPVSMPGALDAIVYRCLSKNPDERYQSVAELAYALAPYAGDTRAAAIVIERTQNILRWTPPPVGVRPATEPTGEPTTLGSSAGAYPAQPPRKQHRRGLVIGGVAAVLIGASLAAFTAIGSKKSDETAATQPAPPPTAPAPTKVEEPKPVVDEAKPAVVDEAKPKIEEKAAIAETPKPDKAKTEKKSSRRTSKTEKTEAKPKVEVAKPEPKPEPVIEKKPDPPKPKRDPLDSRM